MGVWGQTEQWQLQEGTERRQARQDPARTKAKTVWQGLDYEWERRWLDFESGWLLVAEEYNSVEGRGIQDKTRQERRNMHAQVMPKIKEVGSGRERKQKVGNGNNEGFWEAQDSCAKSNEMRGERSEVKSGEGRGIPRTRESNSAKSTRLTGQENKALELSVKVAKTIAKERAT
ncbi:hypothetical protein EDB83DRAFT_2321827 [Lactarius deliciosus]|nr:hypothetical protein EDB83DRAFT_2321827 [Lactarius deliciosus]